MDTARLEVETLRQEGGRITILKKVSNIFSFYGALGIQYIAPYLILLSSSLLLSASSMFDTTELPEVDLGSGNVNVFRSSGLGINSFHGCVAFMCWWVCFTNAVTSGFDAVLRELIII